MKLIRYGEKGKERPGILMGDNLDTILDIRHSAFDIEDFNAHFFSTHGLERLKRLFHESHAHYLPAKGIRLGAPIARPDKIICLGKNYRDHAEEFDAVVPDTPIYFSKATSSINGPNDNIILPSCDHHVDIEVELAIVIGATGKHIPAENAMTHIAGVMILNDITDRKAQRESKQWFRGKGCDTFCPMGPWLVTLDEITDITQLKLCSKINDQELQTGITSDLIFDIPFIINHISRQMTLEAGDVISTGTPGGIGSARNPPITIKSGDAIEVGIEGLGMQRNQVV